MGPVPFGWQTNQKCTRVRLSDGGPHPHSTVSRAVERERGVRSRLDCLLRNRVALCSRKALRVYHYLCIAPIWHGTVDNLSIARFSFRSFSCTAFVASVHWNPRRIEKRTGARIAYPYTIRRRRNLPYAPGIVE
jgi:hypothetical protein